MQFIKVNFEELSKESYNNIVKYLNENQEVMRCEDIYKVKQLIEEVRKECDRLSNALLESHTMQLAETVTKRYCGNTMTKKAWNHLWSNAQKVCAYKGRSKGQSK